MDGPGTCAGAVSRQPTPGHALRVQPILGYGRRMGSLAW